MNKQRENPSVAGDWKRKAESVASGKVRRSESWCKKQPRFLVLREVQQCFLSVGIPEIPLYVQSFEFKDDSIAFNLTR